MKYTKSSFTFKNLTSKLFFLLPLSMAITALVPTVASAGVKTAMTWKTLNYINNWDGQATHAYALVGSDNITNAYVGDTSNTNFLPILCIKKANLPKPGVVPAPTVTPGGASRGTWSGGYIGFTPPVLGTLLTSRSVADGVCATVFGSGYRMAEFHDGDPAYWAGWDFWAEVVLPPNPALVGRFWVAINDQPANPW